MSRSRKIPMTTLTPKTDKFSKRAARRKVKMELAKPEPDINILEGDTDANGHDEWGTRLGWPTAEILEDDPYAEQKRKQSRK